MLAYTSVLKESSLVSFKEQAEPETINVRMANLPRAVNSVEREYDPSQYIHQLREGLWNSDRLRYCEPTREAVAHTRNCQSIDRVKAAMKKRDQIIGQLHATVKDLKSMVTTSKKFEAAAPSSSTDEHPVAAPSSSTDGHPAFYSLYLDTFDTAVGYH